MRLSSVQYDAPLGFRSQIYIDRDRRMADEDVGYEVSAVEACAED